MLLAGSALAAVLAVSAARAAEQSPTIVKLMTSDVVVDANGLDTRTMHVEITATNEAAAMDVGQTSLPYSESMQELEIVEAYTLKANGDRLPVAANAIYTQQPQSAPQLQTFDDVRQKVIVFPNVAAGDTIVYTARWRDKIAAIPGHFTYTEFYRPSVDYNDVRGSITAPKSLPLKIENHDVTVERQETRDAVTYSWRYSAQAAQTVDRPYVSPLDRIPRILVSSLESHDALGRAYAALIAPKETVTPRIQALADQVTAGIANKRQQAEKIYEWVSKNIRYVAVDIGNGGIIPHDADVTLANGYGDCKDHAVLFGALLKAKGIASEVALINLGNTYSLPAVSMIYPFNHAITWLPEFGLYVDTTAGVAPFGTLPFDEYGKPVVHAVASGGLRRTPVLPANAASISLKTTARLDRDGKVTGESTVTAAGPSALLLRKVGLSVQANGPPRYAASALERQGARGTGTIDVPPPTELGPTYTLTSRFEYTNRDLVSGKGFGMIRGIWLTPVTGDSLMGPVFDVRQNDAEPTACFSGHADEELKLELPAGAPIGVSSDNFEIKTNTLQFTARWSVSGSVITIRREFTSAIDQPLCADDVRKETARALQQIRDHYDRALISYNSGQPAIANIDSDFIAGTIALSRGEYDTAVRHLTAALQKTDLAPELRTQTYVLRGDAYNFQRDPPRAIVDYTESLRLKPDQPRVLNARGALFGFTQQYEKSLADFTEAIRLAPDVPEYYAGRATTLSDQGKFYEAAQDLSEVIRLRPDDQVAHVNRARAYDREGLFERAIADCDAAIRLGRNTAECYVVRGNGNYALARHEQAISDFTTAIQIQPDLYNSFLGRGVSYLATNQPDKALTDFDSSVRLGPDDARTFYGRAVAKERLGDSGGAEFDLASARRIDPDTVLTMSSLGVIRGSYVQGRDDLALCKAAVQARDLHQGTIFCSRALSSALGAEDKSAAHVSIAALHRGERHFPEAHKHYDEALRLTPNSASIHVSQGVAYRMANELDRAMQSYDQAIRIDPSFALAYSNRGFIHRTKGQLDAAFEDYSEAIRLNPRYLVAFISRGGLESERQRYADAIEDFGKALDIDRNNSDALTGRCFALAASGKGQEALADCNAALSFRPGSLSALTSRAYSYLRLQDFAAAIRDYDAALSVNPDLAASLFGRGVAKIKAGNAEQGNADIAEALKRDPEVAVIMAKHGLTP